MPFAELRHAWDAIADGYVGHFGTDVSPEERSYLTSFAAALPPGPVLEVGCGAGRIALALRGLGVPVAGTDLSRGMLRHADPTLDVAVADLTALPVADAVLSGLVSWYSVVNLQPAVLDAAFAEFARVLAPGGVLLVAFQVGEGMVRRERPFGQDVVLEFLRSTPERVRGLLEEAGLEVTVSETRAPDATENAPQAFLQAVRRP